MSKEKKQKKLMDYPWNGAEPRQTPQSVEYKKYVPYGINGEYFVYDNELGQVPMGLKAGTKKQIQKICDAMNNPPELGAAQINIELTDSKIIVRHTDKNGSLLFEKDAVKGDWDKIWAAIRNK